MADEDDDHHQEGQLGNEDDDDDEMPMIAMEFENIPVIERPDQPFDPDGSMSVSSHSTHYRQAHFHQEIQDAETFSVGSTTEQSISTVESFHPVNDGDNSNDSFMESVRELSPAASVDAKSIKLKSHLSFSESSNRSSRSNGGVITEHFEAPLELQLEAPHEYDDDDDDYLNSGSGNNNADDDDEFEQMVEHLIEREDTVGDSTDLNKLPVDAHGMYSDSEGSSRSRGTAAQNNSNKAADSTTPPATPLKRLAKRFFTFGRGEEILQTPTKVPDNHKFEEKVHRQEELEDKLSASVEFSILHKENDEGEPQSPAPIVVASAVTTTQQPRLPNKRRFFGFGARGEESALKAPSKPVEDEGDTDFSKAVKEQEAREDEVAPVVTSPKTTAASKDVDHLTMFGFGQTTCTFCQRDFADDRVHLLRKCMSCQQVYFCKTCRERGSDVAAHQRQCAERKAEGKPADQRPGGRVAKVKEAEKTTEEVGNTTKSKKKRFFDFAGEDPAAALDDDDDDFVAKVRQQQKKEAAVSIGRRCSKVKKVDGSDSEDKETSAAAAVEVVPFPNRSQPTSRKEAAVESSDEEEDHMETDEDDDDFEAQVRRQRDQEEAVTIQRRRKVSKEGDDSASGSENGDITAAVAVISPALSADESSEEEEENQIEENDEDDDFEAQVEKQREQERAFAIYTSKKVAPREDEEGDGDDDDEEEEDSVVAKNLAAMAGVASTYATRRRQGPATSGTSSRDEDDDHSISSSSSSRSRRQRGGVTRSISRNRSRESSAASRVAAAMTASPTSRSRRQPRRTSPRRGRGLHGSSSSSLNHDAGVNGNNDIQNLNKSAPQRNVSSASSVRTSPTRTRRRTVNHSRRRGGVESPARRQQQPRRQASSRSEQKQQESPRRRRMRAAAPAALAVGSALAASQLYTQEAVTAPVGVKDKDNKIDNVLPEKEEDSVPSDESELETVEPDEERSAERSSGHVEEESGEGLIGSESGGDDHDPSDREENINELNNVDDTVVAVMTSDDSSEDRVVQGDETKSGHVQNGNDDVAKSAAQADLGEDFDDMPMSDQEENVEEQVQSTSQHSTPKILLGTASEESASPNPENELVVLENATEEDEDVYPSDAPMSDPEDDFEEPVKDPDESEVDSNDDDETQIEESVEREHSDNGSDLDVYPSENNDDIETQVQAKDSRSIPVVPIRALNDDVSESEPEGSKSDSSSEGEHIKECNEEDAGEDETDDDSFEDAIPSVPVLAADRSKSGHSESESEDSTERANGQDEGIGVDGDGSDSDRDSGRSEENVKENGSQSVPVVPIVVQDLSESSSIEDENDRRRVPIIPVIVTDRSQAVPEDNVNESHNVPDEDSSSSVPDDSDEDGRCSLPMIPIIMADQSQAVPEENVYETHNVPDEDTSSSVPDTSGSSDDSADQYGSSSSDGEIDEQVMAVNGKEAITLPILVNNLSPSPSEADSEQCETREYVHPIDLPNSFFESHDNPDDNDIEAQPYNPNVEQGDVYVEDAEVDSDSMNELLDMVDGHRAAPEVEVFEDEPDYAQTRSGDKYSPAKRKARKCLGCLVLAIFLCNVVAALFVVWLFYLKDDNSGNGTLTTVNIAGDDIKRVDPTPYATSPPKASEVPVEPPAGCNGLENLCDVHVNHMLFATLHNAAASAADGFGSHIKNHNLPLEEALEAGFRGINLDIGKCENGELALVHGRCSFGTRDPVEVFTNIVSFLRKNPSEVLIMPTQIENGAGGGDVLMEDISKLFLEVPELINLLYAHPGPSDAWPTLRELIDADNRILFFHYDGVEDCDDPAVTCHPAFHKYFNYATETGFEFVSMQELKDERLSCSQTRGLDGEKDFFGMNVFTMDPELCEFSNEESFLQDHIQDCANFNSMQPNMLLVDCWETGDVLSAVQKHNAAIIPTSTVSADVELEFRGLTSNIIEPNLSGFLETCSQIFGDHLGKSLYRDIECEMMDQEIVSPNGLQVLQALIRVHGKTTDPENTLERSELETIIEGEASWKFRNELFKVSTFFTSIESLYVVGSGPSPTQVPTGGGAAVIDPPSPREAQTVAPTPTETGGAITLTPQP